jgi:hypothetical protein
MLNSAPPALTAITETCPDCDGCAVVTVRLPGGTRCMRPCFTCDGEGEVAVRRCSCGREPCIAVLDEGSSFRRPVCSACLDEADLSALGAA